MQKYIVGLVAFLVGALALQGLWMLFATNPMTISPLVLYILALGTLVGIIAAICFMGWLVGRGASYLFFGTMNTPDFNQYEAHALTSFGFGFCWAIGLCFCATPTGASIIALCSIVALLGLVRYSVFGRKPAN